MTLHDRVRSTGRRTLDALDLGLRRATVAARADPGFFLLGAQKAGTSSLFTHLVEHPRVLPPFRKEIEYYSVHHASGALWYRAHFPTRARLAAAGPGALTGEATTYYLDHPWAPSRVSAAHPDARFVVLLRDPVRRCISHFHHARFYDFEPEDTLAAGLAVEAERLEGERERMLADPDYDSFDLRHRCYRARGRYAEHLERWLAHVDRSQLLILCAEHLFADPRRIVDHVTEHLGLDPLPEDTRFTPRNTRSYGDTPDEVVAELARFYAPWNERLFSLVGERWDWTTR